MPLTPPLAVSGSPCRSLALASRLFGLQSPPPIAVWSIRSHCSTWPLPGHSSSFPLPASIRGFRGLVSGGSSARYHENRPHLARRGGSCSSKDRVPESECAPFAPVFGTGAGDMHKNTRHKAKAGEGQLCRARPIRYRWHRLLPSRSKTKARRQSQPARILDAMQSSARDMYTRTPLGKIDLSYSRPQRRAPAGLPRRGPESWVPSASCGSPTRTPISLYDILTRYIETVTASPWAVSDYEMSPDELVVLQTRGYSQKNIQVWAQSLVAQKSHKAVGIFLPGASMPPLFLVLLFLRRKHMKTFTLGIVLRHVELRLKLGQVGWKELKMLLVRMLRHARIIWPESIPWIASVLTSEVTKLLDKTHENGGLSINMLSDVTHFCNIFLSLLSLPTNMHPMLFSLSQEQAQFQVLHLMASRDPALIVTRAGFRAVIRNQLTHKKTAQEQEWAKLKRESWPPWKENRNAMDEEKGYEFGTSRASRILHRMYEAGYEGRRWEQVVGLYTGWDTDLSPTIQTRTSLPYTFPQYRNQTRLEAWLWAGRVRTTRTRKEAWACFLAYEASGAPARQEVYVAMFEKLHYPEMQQEEPKSKQSDTTLLPGDTKEVMPEPESPLHHVYLNEPIPSFEQLYYRMVAKDLRPTNRFLAFLLQITRDYAMGLQLLESAREDFGGGIQCLLDGTYMTNSAGQQLPGYIVAAFINFSCRFGRFSRLFSTIAPGLSSEEHMDRIKNDRHYLLEYAYALLLTLRPHYRPAWTAFMRKIILGCTALELRLLNDVTIQYKVAWRLIEKAEEEDLDIDDEQFRLLCISTARAAQQALKGDLPSEDAQHIFTTGAHRVRTLFHILANSNQDNKLPQSIAHSNAVPSHIPPPTTLHAYVRALGILRDYEGLYSFASWAASHHVEVTARANAQHSGPQGLFSTLVALRAGLEGAPSKSRETASTELKELIRGTIESVEGWDWPSEEDVQRYKKNRTWRRGMGLSDLWLESSKM